MSVAKQFSESLQLFWQEFGLLEQVKSLLLNWQEGRETTLEVSEKLTELVLKTLTAYQNTQDPDKLEILQNFLSKLQQQRQNRSFYFPQGIASYVQELTRFEKSLTPIIQIENHSDKFHLEVALVYTDTYNEKLLAFTNGVSNPEGGMHVTGFRIALTRLINNYASNRGLFKKENDKFSYEDLKEGLRVILSIKMVDPQFTSQSKVKLGSTIARTLTDKLFSEKFSIFLEENPQIAQTILNKASLALKARMAAKAARETVLRKNILESTTLPGKLADCRCKDPSKSEIYLVEGASAGGSAKQGRDSEFQSILPLRGKVLNTEKANLAKMLASEEIKNMILAFGCGVGEQFDIQKLRYHKIILMADADVDGAHITTLILTFFYRYLQPLVTGGYVYLARPPLYKITIGKKDYYAYTEEEKKQILSLNGLQDSSLDSQIDSESEDLISEEVQENKELNKENQELSKRRFSIQRYKGLGEMNPEQLWETTMNPKTRLLFRVTIEDAQKANEILECLMGSNVEPRKKFIEQNAIFAVIDTI